MWASAGTTTDIPYLLNLFICIFMAVGAFIVLGYAQSTKGNDGSESQALKVERC